MRGGGAEPGGGWFPDSLLGGRAMKQGVQSTGHAWAGRRGQPEAGYGQSPSQGLPCGLGTGFFLNQHGPGDGCQSAMSGCVRHLAHRARGQGSRVPGRPRAGCKGFQSSEPEPGVQHVPEDRNLVCEPAPRGSPEPWTHEGGNCKVLLPS